MPKYAQMSTHPSNLERFDRFTVGIPLGDSSEYIDLAKKVKNRVPGLQVFQSFYIPIYELNNTPALDFDRVIKPALDFDKVIKAVEDRQEMLRGTQFRNVGGYDEIELLDHTRRVFMKASGGLEIRSYIEAQKSVLGKYQTEQHRFRFIPGVPVAQSVKPLQQIEGRDRLTQLLNEFHKTNIGVDRVGIYGEMNLSPKVTPELLKPPTLLVEIRGFAKNQQTIIYELEPEKLETAEPKIDLELAG